MQPAENHNVRVPLVNEEAARKIKIAFIIPAGLLCCTVMFFAS